MNKLLLIIKKFRKPFIILAVFLILGAIFLHFTKGTKAVGWWNGGGGSWQARKMLTITNNSSSSLSANTTVAITIDTATLVSQGKLRSDCADLRVLYQPSSSTTTELSRSLSYASTATGAGTCANSYATKVFIPLQAALSSAASSTDYYLYYKNPSASAPSSTDNAFDISSIDATLVCPFDGTTTCAAGETPSTESGAVRYSGSKSAMNFDGLNDNINVGTSAGTFSANQPFTMEAWVKFDARAVSASITRIIQFNTNLGIGPVAGGGIRFQFPTDAGGLDTVAGSLPIGSWAHVAGVYDGTTRYIYVNGRLVTSGAVSLAAFQPTCGSVGADYSSCNSSTPTRVAPGLIDEVRVSTIARYTSNFTPQTTPFVRDANTRLLLHFDENGDDPRVTGKVIDDSGNNFNGTINGAKYTSGLVGVDASTSDTGNISRQSYAGHEGVFIEEGTTNLITNPSFENSTWDTNWTTNSNLTSTYSATAPFFKFGSKSARLVASASAISGTSNMFTTNIDVGSSATQTLSAYVYDGTSGNVGGTVTSSIVKPVFNGASVGVGVSYTDAGGGWWRMSYSTSTAGAQDFGVEPQVSKTIYVDGVQLETKSYATTYADGTLGTGYAWTGTANNSTSSRTVANMKYDISGNVNTSTLSVSMWVQPIDGLSTTNRTFLGTPSGKTGPNFSIKTSPNCSNNKRFIFEDNTGHMASDCSTVLTPNKWYHLVGTWDGTTIKLYVNGTIGGVTGTSFSFNATTFLTVGYDETGNGSPSNSIVSDMRFFDNALSSTQVTDLYQAGLVGHQQQYQVDAFGDTKGQNPVSTYHMDEATGSTVYDSTLQANNLTLGSGSSAPSWETSHSVSNQINPRAVSLKFDGSNDYISRTYDSDFDPGTDSFSVSGWFRHPSTISGTDTLLARYGSAGYKVYMNSSGYICFGIDDDSTWGPDDSACSTTSYADSKWHTFEAVKTSTTSITLYLDGRSVASDSSLAATATLNPGVTTSMYMGIDSDFASNPWDGYLDEFNFYPYARSAAQVKTDYAAAQLGTTLGANVDDPLTNGLVGYWKMDENTGATVVDSSGNGNTGNLTNGASFSAGKFGTEVLLDGSNDYMDINNTSITTGSLTYSAWIKPTAVGGDIIANMGTLYSIGNPATSLSWYSDSSQGNVNCSAGGVTLTDGSWHHVALTQSGTRVNCYIDGSFTSTTTAPVINTTATYSSIGARTSGAAPMTGGLDEVRMYNRALSPAEVQQLYNFAPGPVGYWKMDEGSNGSAAVTRMDSSGNGNNLTDNGTVVSTPGKFGAAGQFTAANSEYLSLSDNASLSTGDIDFTISAWVKLNSKSSTRRIVSKSNIGGTIMEYSLYYNLGTDSFYFTLANTAAVVVGASNFGSPSTGTWYYLVAKHDAVNNIASLSVNGGAPNTASTGGTAPADSAQAFNIGAMGGAGFWDGSIDDVKYYNYARTQKQILEDMQGSRPATTAAGQVSGATSALAHWRFDEGQGTTANSVGVGGTGYNGALGTGVSAPTWTNTAKFGKALSFDGGDKVTATIADPTYTNAISLWVNPKNSAASKTLVTAGKLTTDSSSRPVYGGCTGSALTLNAWTHIVAVSDGSSICKIYQNGVQTASSTTGVTLGTLVNIASGSFIGSIDEVKVYAHALSPAEVKSDYNRGATVAYGQVQGADDSGYATDRWWEAGGATGAIAAYQPVSANSLATSYVNVANPGVINAVAGDAPTFAQGTGWTFNGTSDYLSVGATLASGYTALIRFSGAPTSGNNRYGFCSYAGASTNYFCLGLTDAGRTSYVNGSNSLLVTETGHASGVLGFSATNGYADGVNQGSISGWSGTSTQPIYIGARNNQGTADGFTALSVQAFVVYNTSLSAEQIKAVTNAMNKLGANDTNSGPPILEYKFDEASGTTMQDSSGTGNNGTLVAGPTYLPGKKGAALSLDGATQYAISAGGDPLNGTTEWTIESWVYPRNSSFYGFLLAAGASHFVSGGTSSGMTFTWNACSVNKTVTTAAFSANAWHHVVIRYDGSNLTSFIDGVQGSSVTPGACTGYNGSNILIGKGNGSSYFNGMVDDFRVFNYARTPAQIAYDYNGGKPVAHYRMDECSGTTANDSSGNSNTGTITVGASGTQTTAGNCDSNSSASAWSNGKNGKFNAGLNLDGTDDYVTVSDTSVLENSTMTLSAWINPTDNLSLASNAGIVAKRIDATAYVQYGFVVSSGAFYWLQSATGSSWETLVSTSSTPTLLNYGTWHHIVGTNDGTTARLYIDGKLIASDSSPATSLASSAQALTIGLSQASSTYFAGKIDDVRVYNFALSSSQVKNVYNGGAAVYYGPSSGQP